MAYLTQTYKDLGYPGALRKCSDLLSLDIGFNVVVKAKGVYDIEAEK